MELLEPTDPDAIQPALERLPHPVDRGELLDDAETAWDEGLSAVVFQTETPDDEWLWSGIIFPGDLPPNR